MTDERDETGRARRPCSLPTCGRDAADLGHEAPLCGRHAPDEDGAEDDSAAASTSPLDPAGGAPVATVADEPLHPETIRDLEWWVTWILDGEGRKRPVAPWQTGHAYPAAWRGDLDDDDRPETDYETARRWSEFPLADLGLSLPDDARSDSLDLGILLPNDPPEEAHIVLIDWDDVRDPETGEVHPVAAEYIAEYGGYVEVSTSGEGLHQFVLGGLRHRGKFIAPIDVEPFIGGDEPQVEIYDRGRHVAMTGEHVEGSDRDLVDGQDCIDDIIRAYADAELDAGHRTYDPETGATASDGDRDDDTPAPAPAPEPCEYEGPGVEALRESCPADRSLAYHAIVEAFCEGYAGVLNWRLEGAAAALGQREGRTPHEVIDDLRGADRDGGSVGFDTKTAGRVKYDHSRAARGEFSPASWETLASWGVLPGEYVEQVAGEDPEYAVALPNSPRERAENNVWDWRAAATPEESTDGLDDWHDAHGRLIDVLKEELGRFGARTLVDALPSLGKSSGTPEALAALAADGRHEPATIATGRGREEQYEQYEEWCRENGLEPKRLPAFTHDCPTACGDHGDDWQERVMDWYRRGTTAQEIHKYAETELGRPLPCQTAADGEPVECEYAAKWRFDPDDYDVLIGHYSHLHKPKVVQGRTVIVDEFPGDAYETALADDRLKSAVSQFLQRHDTFPFVDYTDLLERRNSDDAVRGEAIAWFLDRGADALDRDPQEVFAGSNGHALAPLATFALLAADDLGNGWERCSLHAVDDDLAGTLVARDRRGESSDGELFVLSPPSFEYTRGVVALDGTPTPQMWRLALDLPGLHHRQVLDDDERREYIAETLGLQLVPTTEYIKPYGNPAHVNVTEDAALLEQVSADHGERPGLISTTTALAEYKTSDEFDLEAVTDGLGYYGNVLGSNEFAKKNIGCVIGSMHYGDPYIKKWGAHADKRVDANGEKGAARSYGDLGDRILTHMREHQTLQATMRFGRNVEGYSVVYVHTDTLPEWVPTAGRGEVLETWSDGLAETVHALADLGTASVREVTEHDAVSIGERQVRDHLETLRQQHGTVTRHADPDDGRRRLWCDDGLDDLGENGAADLPDLAAPDGGDGGGGDEDDDEVPELSRIVSYTWEFRNFDNAPARRARPATRAAGDGRRWRSRDRGRAAWRAAGPRGRTPRGGEVATSGGDSGSAVPPAMHSRLRGSPTEVVSTTTR